MSAPTTTDRTQWLADLIRSLFDQANLNLAATGSEHGINEILDALLAPLTPQRRAEHIKAITSGCYYGPDRLQERIDEIARDLTDAGI